MNLSNVSAHQSTSSLSGTESKQKQQTVSASKSNQTPKTDSFTSSETSLEEITYQPPKKLSTEQVAALKQQVQESMQKLAEKMLGAQADIAKNEDGSIDYTTLAKALGMGTTPETAQEAISKNGMWGVEAVSTRIMDMAIQLSNGDPSMAETLREAVQKGFEAVGALDELPQVCQDTYHEVMNRFDYWEEHGSMDGYGSKEETPAPEDNSSNT